jgi:cellulose synthase/poly-beta-1,6-N-acetylglucosamine synthase-like glycosyltransferase
MQRWLNRPVYSQIVEPGERAAYVEAAATPSGATPVPAAEIQRVARENPQVKIKLRQQPGKGKGDAVRCGFAAATGDILMILDADLTMPPEDLPKQPRDSRVASVRNSRSTVGTSSRTR